MKGKLQRFFLETGLLEVQTGLYSKTKNLNNISNNQESKGLFGLEQFWIISLKTHS